MFPWFCLFSLSFQWEEVQKFPGTLFLGTFLSYFRWFRKAFQPEFGAYRGLARVLKSPSNPRNCRKKEKILKKGTFIFCAKPWYAPNPGSNEIWWFFSLWIGTRTPLQKLPLVKTTLYFLPDVGGTERLQLQLWHEHYYESTGKMRSTTHTQTHITDRRQRALKWLKVSLYHPARDPPTFPVKPLFQRAAQGRGKP